MSDRKESQSGARVVPGKTTPMPEYRYQRYEGKSGGASANPRTVPTQTFADLQNYDPATAG